MLKLWFRGMALLFVVGLAGCNNCEKLVDKLCSDLGPEDCEIWKELDGPDTAASKGRRQNDRCGAVLEELPYESALIAARGLVVREKVKRASKAGDSAALEKLNAEQAALKEQTAAVLEKVKKQAGR
jgi:hypothetical protein